MRCLAALMAMFAMQLALQTSAVGQTQPSPSSQAQGNKRETEPAKESSNEDQGAVGPAKKLPNPIIRLTGAPIHFNKAVASADNTNVLSLGKSQTQPSAPAQSQQPQTASPQGPDDAAELAKKLSNPVSSLISLPFQMNWDSRVGPDEDTRNTLNIQPVMPFKLNDDWYLVARLIMPVVSRPPLTAGGETKFGLSDFLFSAFFTPARPQGVIWAISPAVLVPVTSEPNLGTEKVALGPTGALIKQTGGWTIGVLANHLWSIAGDDGRPDVNQTFIQPVLNYTTKTAWTYGLSAEISLNWEARAREEVTAPVIFSITKLLRLGRQPISLGPGVGYFIDQPGIGPKWRGRFTLTLLFPTGN